ncbi:NAD(P)/FAD-dependent oxidoreductase [Rhodonellum sp.]|uniref:protoporphyrinogen/coproporphyrinogen oxidase n=1 Tax=Rhodonellum sp. TaxID=2231180 RepID=UPI002722D1A7|nr:NAD(P)/FAD-dependent oxidoreductase [Rhodonellum sp.]MDO9553828.1 NAD(P)/FAD-dependent oxidoreductase [Rhodonellum sp.]
MSETKVYIVGAGISGLIAAYELERAGISPVILEASDGVGGRVRTDDVNGFLLDRGFQVLLTAYPEAIRYLDYQELHLKTFDPGAVVMKPGNLFTIHDPLRQPSKVINMAFSPVGTLKDKIKIFLLTQSLKKKSEEEIFAEPSMSTLKFLQQYGFSEKIIENFFKPFFKGIFLEENLETSSRMFKFVFKMFGIGNAAVPELGMQAIPNQLSQKLQKTTIKLNTPVEKIEGNQIILKSGERILADKIIIATRPDLLLPQLSGQFKPDRKVINLYFSLEKSFMISPMIALVPDESFLSNNLVFMTDVSPAYSKEGKALLSVSVIKNVGVDDSLAKKIAIEMEALTGIKSEHFKWIKTYEIQEALPDLDDLQNSIPFSNTKIMDGVFLAGDYLLNGSINAAMTSGRKAAEACLYSLQNPH